MPRWLRRQGANRFFACRRHWYALPRDIQRNIYATAHLPLFDPDRAPVVDRALDWYFTHPDPHQGEKKA